MPFACLRPVAVLGLAHTELTTFCEWLRLRDWVERS